MTKGRYRPRLSTVICLFLIFLASAKDVFAGECVVKSRLEFYSEALKDDYSRFYLDGENLLRLGAVLGISGAMANSEADREVREYYQSNIRSGPTDSVSSAGKTAGDLFVVAPLLIGADMYFDPASPYGRWASDSLRALMLGGPAGLLIQRATGGGRPVEGDSHWRPLEDSNGLSGHAFVGAVPLITAARMQDSPVLKAVFYATSILPALSRINDDRHYASQAVAGWYLAYASAASIDTEPEDRGGLSFLILPVGREGLVGQVIMPF